MTEILLADDDKAVAPRKDRARKLTEEIRHDFESFYLVGMKLREVEWRFLDYNSFKEYVREEFQIGQSRAYQLMAAAELLPKLPKFQKTGNGHKNAWIETHVHELLRLETIQDRIRVARKVVAYVEKNPDEKLTAKVVRRLVEEEKAPKPKRQKRAIEGGGNLHKILMRWIYQMEEWRESLMKNVPKEGWELLCEQQPEVMKRFITECDSWTDLAREVKTNARRSSGSSG